MTKDKLVELVKYTAEEMSAPVTLSDEDAEGIADDFLFSEKEQLGREGTDFKIMLCGHFEPDPTTSSTTKCKCGREKWEHPQKKIV